MRKPWNSWCWAKAAMCTLCVCVFICVSSMCQVLYIPPFSYFSVNSSVRKNKHKGWHRVLWWAISKTINSVPTSTKTKHEILYRLSALLVCSKTNPTSFVNQHIFISFLCVAKDDLGSCASTLYVPPLQALGITPGS